jgi:hypothetical protein
MRRSDEHPVCGTNLALIAPIQVRIGAFGARCWPWRSLHLGTLILDVTLLALTIVIARTFPGRYRLFALIPAGTVAGILFFVAAGGPIMLVTWLAAAAAAVTSGWAAIRGAPTTP